MNIIRGDPVFIKQYWGIYEFGNLIQSKKGVVLVSRKAKECRSHTSEE
jgi:hypothetical protein